MSSNLHTSKEVYGFNSLDVRTHYVCMLLELLPTMLQLANISLGSSPVKNLSVCVVIIPSNQEDIFFMIVQDLMGIGTLYHMQVHLSRNYIPIVISSPNYTSLSSIVATFLTTCLMAVLQLSGYSVFHGGDTSIQLGLPWWSYPCQYLNTKTSAWNNKSFTTETPSISYTIHLYIRLVVTL